MKGMRLAVIVAVAIALAAPAQADEDTDFANQLHTYGIYGPRDYNAWLGKILCDRLHKGVDANAFESTQFVAANFATRHHPGAGVAGRRRRYQLLLPRPDTRPENVGRKWEKGPPAALTG
jgi:hypothetical protein